MYFFYNGNVCNTKYSASALIINCNVTLYQKQKMLDTLHHSSFSKLCLIQSDFQNISDCSDISAQSVLWVKELSLGHSVLCLDAFGETGEI